MSLFGRVRPPIMRHRKVTCTTGVPDGDGTRAPRIAESRTSDGHVVYRCEDCGARLIVPGGGAADDPPAR